MNLKEYNMTDEEIRAVYQQGIVYQQEANIQVQQPYTWGNSSLQIQNIGGELYATLNTITEQKRIMFEGFVFSYLIDQGRAMELINYLRLK